MLTQGEVDESSPVLKSMSSGFCPGDGDWNSSILLLMFFTLFSDIIFLSWLLCHSFNKIIKIHVIMSFNI